MLHDIEIVLLQAGYAKRTIDGVFSSLSAVLGYAKDDERIEVNVAYGMRVDPGDPEDEATFRPGLKTTKGVRTKTKEERGRWTLFPAALFSVGPVRLHRRLLFPSPTGMVWGQRNFYRDAWDPASKLAGTKFTVYDLRHTFISHLLANGIPTVEVAYYAGHSTQQLGDIDNTTTRIYQHPTGDYREAALEAVNGYLAQLETQKLATAR